MGFKTMFSNPYIPLDVDNQFIIEQGVFTDLLKASKVAPIKKKYDPTKTNNYQPIAIF